MFVTACVDTDRVIVVGGATHTPLVFKPDGSEDFVEYRSVSLPGLRAGALTAQTDVPELPDLGTDDDARTRGVAFRCRSTATSLGLIGPDVTLPKTTPLD